MTLKTVRADAFLSDGMTKEIRRKGLPTEIGELDSLHDWSVAFEGE